jgi:hypothetical protein
MRLSKNNARLAAIPFAETIAGICTAWYKRLISLGLILTFLLAATPSAMALTVDEQPTRKVFVFGGGLAEAFGIVTCIPRLGENNSIEANLKADTIQSVRG